MKKLVFMFVAMAAISFASCNKTQKPAPEEVDSTVVEIEITEDTTAAGDTAAIAKDTAAVKK